MSLKKTQNRTNTTRLAMIEAATDVFSHSGFHAASNRELAKAAGVNLALISYHFDGKEGLYLAVFEHINEQISKRLNPVLDRVRVDTAALAHSDPNQNKERLSQCVKMLESLLFAMAEMLASEQMAPWAKLILKEQQEPSAAFDILSSGVMGKLLAALSELVAIALQKNKADPEVKLCALNLLGQVQILRAARATVMLQMGWDEISSEELTLIKKLISFQIKALFTGGQAA